VLRQLAEGLPVLEADAKPATKRRATFRLRQRMGARTNAMAVALAFREGILKPRRSTDSGFLAAVAVRHALEDPRLTPHVVGAVISRIHHAQDIEPRFAENMVADISAALNRHEMDMHEAERWRGLMRELDTVMAAEFLDRDAQERPQGQE